MSNDQYAGKRKVGNGRTPRLWVLAAACLTLLVTLGSPTIAAPAGKDAAVAGKDAAVASSPFAKVGDTVISHQEFEAAFAQAARSKFYHGKPPENGVATLQREVGQGMVDEILLAREAKRRKIQPDQASIKKTLDGYEKQYQASEQWKNNRERLLPGLKAKLERDSLLEQLGKQVKGVEPPTPRQLEQYWETHKDKFTSPEQVHVSIILLKVDPSSPQAQWDGARAEGAAIVKRLKTGADFKDLAKLHSGDGSAERGGDMGYVHQGMLPDAAQQVVDKLKPGEISDPVQVLEGVAVLRLEGRKPPKLNPLSAVRERAGDLWAREQGEQAWAALKVKLRRDTAVKIDESRFLPLTTAAKPADNPAPR